LEVVLAQNEATLLLHAFSQVGETFVFVVDVE